MERIPIRLVVCDIDDTLIYKDNRLSQDMIREIQELTQRYMEFCPQFTIIFSYKDRMSTCENEMDQGALGKVSRL